MALLDAYATAAEYKARVEQSSADDDDDILEILTAVSRVIEREVGDGVSRIFNQTAANTVRYFDGTGGARLWVTDLVSVDTNGIEVDESNDGTYATNFDPTTETWSVLYPYHADEISWPYTRIDLLPRGDNTVLTRWPSGVHNIKITGTWGWPAVPDAIREATVIIASQLIDLQKAGMTLELQGLDGAVQLTPGGPTLLRRLKATYSRKIPGVA